MSIAADPVSPDAGKGIAIGLEKAWITLFTGNGSGTGSFFGTLANVFKGIGVIALVMQFTFVMFKMVASENSVSAKEFARSMVIVGTPSWLRNRCFLLGIKWRIPRWPTLLQP
jgi:hypothetical protein